MTDVYDPREDSHLLAKFVHERARGRTIDIGTGSGILALAAAKNPDVTEVTALDINQDAVDALQRSIAQRPIAQNRIIALRSDLFSAVGDATYDTIICNPPYLPTDNRAPDPALDGGESGYEWSVRFLEQAGAHLAQNGRILFLFSNLTNKERIDQTIKRLGYLAEELCEEAVGLFERLYVYQLRRRA